ncbi:MAG: hypothetical protein D8M58_05360 [Calditrichaeota bacterium]|nr:MAG: hypothetical protein DWQ03_21145 [Calditrichota bacterium]MBL1204803.1 hypothetical protein [Calditrichota bacterium]NOG44632.1 hypothetical protein [Calditrichota bacterium]
MRILLFFVPFLIFGNIHGQAKTWDILTYSNQPYSKVVLDTLVKDSLQVKVFDKIYKIPVDSIATLRRERESYTGTGILIGVTSGAILGASISGNNKGNGLFTDVGNAMEKVTGLLFGSLLGGLFGGAIGSGLGQDEFYSFVQKTHNEKVDILNEIISDSNLAQKYSNRKIHSGD